MNTEPTPDLLTRIKSIQRALTEALAAAIRHDQATRGISIIDVTGVDLRPRVTGPELASLVADCRNAVDELARIIGCGDHGSVRRHATPIRRASVGPVGIEPTTKGL